MRKAIKRILPLLFLLQLIYSCIADKDEFMAYAVSIENLEYETGIDFFCNLPNEVEKKVEAVYSEEDWAW